MCQYNNIYKRKKVQMEHRKKKKKNYNYCSYNAVWHCSYCSKLKKKRQCCSPKLHYRWTVENVVWIVAKHCSGIAAFYIVNRYIRKKSTNWWLKKKIHIEQTKSTINFTHLPNKCHNIFTKHLFLVVVGHSFIFYYFILTYKKLTPQ